MSVTLPTSITGGAQTGFTTPGYTTVIDSAVDSNMKQNAVSAITGTQAGVDVHSISRPFTVSVTRPKTFQALGKPNPITGLVPQVPMNVYKVIARKGLLPLADQPSVVGMINCEIRIPAGADVADAANVRALLSAFIGTLNGISAGLGDSLIAGYI